MPPTRRVHLEESLKNSLRILPPTLKSKIRSAFDALVADPQIGKPLREDLLGLWSLRVGRFRIVYRIQDYILEIVAIGPRSTIYQETSRRIVKTS